MLFRTSVVLQLVSFRLRSLGRSSPLLGIDACEHEQRDVKDAMKKPPVSAPFLPSIRLFTHKIKNKNTSPAISVPPMVYRTGRQGLEVS